MQHICRRDGRGLQSRPARTAVDLSLPRGVSRVSPSRGTLLETSRCPTACSTACHANRIPPVSGSFPDNCIFSLTVVRLAASIIHPRAASRAWTFTLRRALDISMVSVFPKSLCQMTTGMFLLVLIALALNAREASGVTIYRIGQPFSEAERVAWRGSTLSSESSTGRRIAIRPNSIGSMPSIRTRYRPVSCSPISSGETTILPHRR